jgi:hypothetical protein
MTVHGYFLPSEVGADHDRFRGNNRRNRLESGRDFRCPINV